MTSPSVITYSKGSNQYMKIMYLKINIFIYYIRFRKYISFTKNLFDRQARETKKSAYRRVSLQSEFMLTKYLMYKYFIYFCLNLMQRHIWLEVDICKHYSIFLLGFLLIVLTSCVFLKIRMCQIMMQVLVRSLDVVNKRLSLNQVVSYIW